MTDGTTAIQVSPITEDDMNRVQDILKRAVDTMVGMSQLQADVTSLQQTVNELRQSTDHYRDTIATQDEAMSALRRDRDEAKNNNVSLAQQSNRFQAEVAKAHHDRDEALLSAMQLTEDLKKANAKLDAAKAFLTDDPKAAQPNLVEQPYTMVDHDRPAPEMKPVIQPEPSADEAHKPSAPTRNYHTGWAAGRIWDQDKQAYYDEFPF